MLGCSGRTVETGMLLVSYAAWFCLAVICGAIWVGGIIRLIVGAYRWFGSRGKRDA